jgi:hypothetical protein
MFGQINHRFPVTVETIEAESGPDGVVAPDEVELGRR